MPKTKSEDHSDNIDISEVLEPVHRVLEELIKSEKNGNLHDYEFTSNDTVAVTLLYSLVLGNKLLYKLINEATPIGLTIELNRHYIATLKELTLAMSDVDTTKYFARRK